MESEVQQVLLAKAVQATREGVVITDARSNDNPIIYFNSAFLATTGYTASEVLGRNCRFLQADDRMQDEVVRMSEAISDGTAIRVTIRNYRRDGTMFWNDVSISPIRGEDGGITHFVGITADVTEQRLAQEQRQLLESQAQHRQRLEALGTLASGIAHDVNNTLVPITSLSQFLSDRLTLQSVERDAAEQILRAGSRIRDLVSQIVTFSRRQSPLPTTLDFAFEIEEAVDAIRSSFPAGVMVNSHFVDRPTILGDRGRLHQVILNLLTNATFAVRNVDSSLIELTLDVSQRPEDEPLLAEGYYAHLVVKDNGEGMDIGTRNRAIDPFFTTKGPQDGSGMGLAIVHGIVSTAGGAIKLESALGAGTSVHIYWPVFP